MLSLMKMAKELMNYICRVAKHSHLPTYMKV